jgi:hypothetical protein
MKDVKRLENLFSDILDRPTRPTWIVGEPVGADGCAVRLTYEDIELLRKRCRPWWRRFRWPK